MRSRPDDFLTVADFVASAYPGVNEPLKKHRVAVVRAADRAMSACEWGYVRHGALGGRNIYFNMRSIASYGAAKLRAAASGDFSDTDIRMMAAGVMEPPHWLQRYLDWCKEGEAFWNHVETWKAQLDGRDDDAAKLIADREARAARAFAGLR